MAAITLSIETPEGPVFAGVAQSVVLPGSLGELGVLPRHAPLIATLAAGTVRLAAGEGEKRVRVAGGVVRVLEDRVQVLTSKAEAL